MSALIDPSSRDLVPSAAGARALARSDNEEAIDARHGGALAERLQRRYRDRITGHFTLPGREGRYAPLPEDLPESLKAALRARGIERLYSHQAEAW
ncbi:hypothetical protein AB4084_34365, partial [Lysobacter sp. 2RAB21]